MSLLLLADSNVERVWLSVRNNRERLRDAIFVAVKRYDQMQSGFQAILPSVSIFFFKKENGVKALSGVLFRVLSISLHVLVLPASG